MPVWGRYLVTVAATLGVFVAVSQLLMSLDIYLIDPNDKSPRPGLTMVRISIAASIAAAAAYPVLSVWAYSRQGSVLRYVITWVALLVVFEGCVQLIAFDILTGPQGAALFFILTVGSGHFVMRDWVFGSTSSAGSEVS